MKSKRKQTAISETTPAADTEVIQRMDEILRRLDSILILLFDLLPEKELGKSVSMTDKVGYLDSLGYEIGEITKMVGRPSNYTSSRLREYKAKQAKRSKKNDLDSSAHEK